MKSFCRVLVALSLVMCFVAGGCASKTPTAAKTIKVGAILSLSVGLAEHGVSVLHASETFWDEVNNAGGINGYKIELVSADDEGDGDKGLAIAKRFVEVEHVALVLGPVSSTVGIPVCKYLAEQGVPSIGLCSSDAMFTGETGRWYFTASVDNIQYTKGYLMQFQRDQRRNVAIIYTNNAWGVSMRDTVIQNGPNYGVGFVAKTVPVEFNADDATAAVLAAKKNADAAGADALFLITLAREQAACAKAIDAMGWDIPIYCSSAAIDADIAMLGPEPLEGWMSNFNADPNDAYFKEVTERVTEHVGPMPVTMGVVFYEAMKVTEHALSTMLQKGIAPTGSNIRDALEKYSYPVDMKVPGPHTTTIESWGQPPHSLVRAENLLFLKIRNGIAVPY